MNLIVKLLRIFNRLLFKNKIIIVLYGEHSQKDLILKRINFYFKEQTAVFCLNENYFLVRIFNLLPIIKLHFGLENKHNLSKPYLWFDIDPLTNPFDAWEYHYILSKYSKRDCINIFSDSVLLNNKINKTKSYLFATGNSLSNAINHQFSDGYIIVCNTIVKDKLLWNHLKPDFIVAGDALYHFSDSEFAVKFRKDLKERLLETDNTFFIYPDIYDQFVVMHFKEFLPRLISVPLGNDKIIHTNLLEKFELPSFGNVLNLLMLPLGCTLSKNIYLWGFDGRAPKDSDFWKNSNLHFYSESVQELKISHPAFFDFHIPKGNETSYVTSVHGDSLDACLSIAESEGFKFNMMHFSYTPALQKRITNG